MKNSKIIIVLVAFMLSFSSCMDTIDLDIQSKESLVTIDAFVNDLRQDQIIRLTRTDNYFSGQVPPYVQGAIVILYDLDSKKSFMFNDNGKGEYIYKINDMDTIVFSDHNYELTIEIGTLKYKSVASTKRSTHIDALYYDTAKGGADGMNSKGLKMLARDARGPVADYYWVKSYLNGQILKRVDQIKLEYFGFNNELDGGYFNPLIWSNPGQLSDETNLKKGDKVRVEILGISRETYDFLSLGKQMSNNGGLFATTSVNLPSNIIPVSPNAPRATGVFNIGQSTTKEITIE